MKEPKEIYYLPVEQLSDDVIQYIEKVFELLDAVKNDCNSNNFSRRFTFIRDEKAISDVAEIKKDNNKLITSKIDISLIFINDPLVLNVYITAIIS